MTNDTSIDQFQIDQFQKRQKKIKTKIPTNKHELTIHIVPTATGGLQVSFTEKVTAKKAGKTRTETEKTADPFAVVSAAIQAIDIRIGDFVERIKEEDKEIGPLFTEIESTSKKKRKK